ncbi:MAG: ATP-binding cassette domain-containing protein, partial [Inhella sp.]
LAGQRIGILGANGQGKSTVVKTLAGMLKPLAGQMVEGKGLAIGYFAQQEMDLLQPDDHALGHMVRLAKQVSPDAREQQLRDFLGQFNFSGELALQAVGSLSGGERARLVLALIAWSKPNLLLLDEPTNHLDLTTREALAMALNDFDGTVLLVSHDRALLRDTCEQFWLVADGALREFDGDLDDYQRWLNERAKAERSAERAVEKAAGAAAPAKLDRKASAALRQQAAPLKKEMDGIDRQLAAWGAERAQLEAELSGGSASGERIAAIGRRLKTLSDEVEEAELRWLELGEQVEVILSGAGA